MARSHKIIDLSWLLHFMSENFVENRMHPASQTIPRLLYNPLSFHLKSTQHVAYDRNADAVGARLAVLCSAAGVERQVHP